MLRLTVVTLLAAVLLGGACGSRSDIFETPVRFATLADLTGPWQRFPSLLDPVMRERVADACRREIELAPGSIPAVIDARGAGVVTVRMTGARAGSCDALEITPAGDVTGAGGGWGQSDPERLPMRADGTLDHIQRGQIGGGGLKVEGWSVYGRAGLAVASVEVSLPGGQTVIATLEEGWFSAWWPAIVPNEQIGIDPFPPVVIRGFAADGTMLDSATPAEFR